MNEVECCSFGFVVVFNRSCTIPLRHIVTLCGPYDPVEFVCWYYGIFFELEGDEFVYCSTREERDSFVDSLSVIE